ncbi:MAG: hypothetical protein WBW88_03305, partial [Rhodothermales bacterium]
MNKNSVYILANGDLRPAANQNCWPVQKKVEEKITQVIESLGYDAIRAHPFDEARGHGFIDSQKHGLEVFRRLDPEIPIIVVFTAWQYSHHILHGLMTHRAPILTLANWSGTWPGLVGMLNMNGSLSKAGVPYSTLWSEAFDDSYFLDGLNSWLESGSIEHDTSHVRPFGEADAAPENRRVGLEVADDLRSRKAILGVFDEGCMGMFNAIIPDHLLNPTGLFKERLSQSTLYFATTQVADDDARACRQWLDARGVRFLVGEDEKTELTDHQIHLQLKMYVAAVRLADEFGCDAIGIQYQQGLKDLLPASDLAEGLLNNTDRPPVFSSDGRRRLYAGSAIPHFNEVDECAGVDALVTHRVWTRLGFPPENTLHDLRWGEQFGDDFVWVFEISGAAPAAHFINGYAGASSERQPPMYFHLGGGTLKGVSRPGQIVWSRVFVEGDRLNADLGLANVVALPQAETERRWKETTPQWPIMHA